MVSAVSAPLLQVPHLQIQPTADGKYSEKLKNNNITTKIIQLKIQCKNHLHCIGVTSNLGDGVKYTGVRKLHANTMLFHMNVLSIPGFWYPWTVLELLFPSYWGAAVHEIILLFFLLLCLFEIFLNNKCVLLYFFNSGG